MKDTVLVPVPYKYDPAPLRQAMRRGECQKKVTQKELARERGCTAVTICRALNGSVQSYDLVTWLCERLNVSEFDVLKPAHNAPQ